jgi:hypothetical protein
MVRTAAIAPMRKVDEELRESRPPKKRFSSEPWEMDTKTEPRAAKGVSAELMRTLPTVQLRRLREIEVDAAASNLEMEPNRSVPKVHEAPETSISPVERLAFVDTESELMRPA